MFALFLANMLLQGFLPAVLLRSQQLALDSVISEGLARSSRALACYAILLLFSTSAENLPSLLQAVLRDKVDQRALALMIERVARVQTLEVFEQELYHDSVRLLGELGAYVMLSVSALRRMVSHLLTGAALIALLMVTHPLVLVLVIASLLPMVFLEKKVISLSWVGLLGNLPERRKLTYLRQLVFDDQVAHERSLFGLRRVLVDKYRGIFDTAYRRQLGIYKKQVAFNELLIFVSWLGAAAGLIVPLDSIVSSGGTAGQIVLTLGAIWQLGYTLIGLSMGYGQFLNTSLRAGQLQTLTELFEAHSSRAGDFHQAEDIAQETFIKAYQRLPSLRSPESFGPWLCTIARRLALDWVRRPRSEPVAEEMLWVGCERARDSNRMTRNCANCWPSPRPG